MIGLRNGMEYQGKLTSMHAGQLHLDSVAYPIDSVVSIATLSKPKRRYAIEKQQFYLFKSVFGGILAGDLFYILVKGIPDKTKTCVYLGIVATDAAQFLISRKNFRKQKGIISRLVVGNNLLSAEEKKLTRRQRLLIADLNKK